jgi:MFS transporter, PPP family, 3-phenylpropionic acid transporter
MSRIGTITGRHVELRVRKRDRTLAAMAAALPLRLALFYAAVFIVVGVRVPFWPPWLAARGLSAAEIGIVLGVTQWAGVAAAPMAGVAVDRGVDARRMMLLLSLAAAAGFLLCLPAAGFTELLLLSAATNAFFSALTPLADNVTLAAAYAGKLDYGRIRLCGSASFVVTVLLIGLLPAERPADLPLVLLIGASALTFLACLALPRGAPALRQARPASWRALTTPRFFVFLAAATLVQGSHTVFYGFGVLQWQSIGLDSLTISLLWDEGVVVEIMLFYWGAKLLRRCRPIDLLVLGGGAGLVRWTVMAFATSVPVLALAQLLHALTFAAAHLGAMHYLARSIPEEHGATGQTVYAAVVGGIGPGLMIWLAGGLYAATGARSYLAMAGLAAAGGLVALTLGRFSTTKS